MASEVADLILDAFAEHRECAPMELMGVREPWTPREELMGALHSDVCTEASHVVLADDRIVSAALAVSRDAECGWWRIVTARGYRRRGFASACVEAGESTLREAGQESMQTEAVVDGRWTGTAAFFESLGYELEDPERRNITMLAEDWTPRPVQLPDGYSLHTFRELYLEDWIAVRNEIFGSERSAEWFRERFMSRPDWDAEGWFMIRHGGQIIGIASAVCVEHERDPERLRGAQVEWVGVLEGHRGLHLGEELMVACMNYAVERGFLPVLLLTQPFRVPAVRLYEKLGFRTIAAWHRWRKSLR